jgi:hypothetical protein
MKIVEASGLGLVILALLCSWDVPAQEWIQANLPQTYWIPVACSADGSRTIVGANGYLYISVDSAVTWVPTTAPENNWRCVGSSADGTKLAAQPAGTNLYLSADAGATWIPRALPRSSQSAVAMSADGAKLFVGGKQGALLSNDGGATWTDNPVPYPAAWVIHVACSSDGNKLIAEAQGPSSPVYVSTNSGVTWWPTAVTNDFPGGVAISADGATMVAASYTFDIGGPVYISTNSGIGWTRAKVPSNYWSSVTCSADGTRMAALAGEVYLSTNSGVTWTSIGGRTGGNTRLASSADGCRLVMAAQLAGVYTYQATPAPVMRISPVGGSIVLSWVIPSMPFSLQESDAVDSGNWTDVATPPTLNLNNLRNEVVLPAPTGPRFYRLKGK